MFCRIALNLDAVVHLVHPRAIGAQAWPIRLGTIAPTHICAARKCAICEVSVSCSHKCEDGEYYRCDSHSRELLSQSESLKVKRASSVDAI